MIVYQWNNLRLMSQKIEVDGQEMEVFTQEEINAAREEGATGVRTELEPKLTSAQKALAERTEQFAGANRAFKKLSDDAVGKLTEAERTIYENQLVMAEQGTRLAEADKKVYDVAVATALRAKVGNDPKVFEEALKMYELINLDDVTVEGITARAAAAVGALGQIHPDLLAAAGISGGGSHMPPQPVTKENESFADTEAGKGLAKKLGMTLEVPKI